MQPEKKSRVGPDLGMQVTQRRVTISDMMVNGIRFWEGSDKWK
jgi:hypothetical protein